MSSLSGLIVGPFARSHVACADDPESPLSFGVCDEDQTVVLRETGGQVSPLVVRMVRIINRDSQRIAEHRRGLVERNSMLGKVLLRLFRIPFNLHTSRLAWTPRPHVNSTESPATRHYRAPGQPGTAAILPREPRLHRAGRVVKV